MTATLLLTACGGGGGAASPEAGKANSTSPSATTAAGAGAGTERPDLSLPADLDLVFDFDEPSDPDHAAALADAANYIRALDHGIAQQDPNDPAYRFYSTTAAARYAKSQIESWVKGGWTVTGKDRYFDASVAPVDDSKAVLVTFCRNQADFFGKVVKTGKTLYTEENLDSYQEFRLLMSRATHAPRVWQARQIEVEGKMRRCKG
jgi:hypothetical protein